ncbi:hypothetical protein BD410DRAFT_898043 [Rickenella mellea]|uniref:Uncharacterized protein n=1 Tax=Rickenella mellea TaxID=50990 RepID=A0A4Y7Q584_9AGAM|nr:hypothetical protein BD410DRAFT_898043 [Rickenella mellea]
MFTRRELTLVAFCLIVFILFYNIETSTDFVRTSVWSISAASLVGLNCLRPDGRRLQKYVDALEREIAGTWNFDEPRKQDLGPHGSTAREGKLFWGYTILDNVYVANATIFLHTDERESFPPLEAMLSSALDSELPPRVHDIQFLPTSDAKPRLGTWAARMNGVSFLAYDPLSSRDNNTLLAIYRTYSTLTLHGTHLPPPDRLILAHTRAADYPSSGIDSRLLRAVFPSMDLQFFEEWDDYHGTNKPFFLERVVLADRGAAHRSAHTFDFAALSSSLPNKNKGITALTLEEADTRLTFTPPFALPTSSQWFAPIRQSLIEYLGITDTPSPSSPSSPSRALTYVSTQARAGGAHLRSADHHALVGALEQLGKTHGWTVHFVELGWREGEPATEWSHHLTAAATSSLMIGVHGDALTNSIFLRPRPSSYAPKPLVMEFFPQNLFSNELEFVTRSLGIDYIGWWENQKFTRQALPPVQMSRAESVEVAIDVDAVVKAVDEYMRRH